MKLKSDITINDKVHPAGSHVSMLVIYPFFLVHMAMFGLSGFFLAYGSDEPMILFQYAHGGIAIFVYLIFYVTMFGVDDVKWMLINGALGLLGIWAEINAILGWFGKSLSDFSPWVHLTPFLYYILYTFLLRQLVIDATGSRENPGRKRLVEIGYVVVSLAVYGWLLLKR